MSIEPYLVFWFAASGFPYTQRFWTKRAAQTAALNKAGILLRRGRIIQNYDWLSENYIRSVQSGRPIIRQTAGADSAM
jgi:hypothetical protein